MVEILQEPDLILSGHPENLCTRVVELLCTLVRKFRITPPESHCLAAL